MNLRVEDMLFVQGLWTRGRCTECKFLVLNGKPKYLLELGI